MRNPNLQHHRNKLDWRICILKLYFAIKISFKFLATIFSSLIGVKDLGDLLLLPGAAFRASATSCEF
jgi:hypothetical protein